jgi:isoamylase
VGRLDRAQPTGIRRLGVDSTLLIVFNAYFEPVPFVVPETTGGTEWTIIIDTVQPSVLEKTQVPFGTAFTSAPRSLQLLALT